jgi:hypothetical protein
MGNENAPQQAVNNDFNLKVDNRGVEISTCAILSALIYGDSNLFKEALENESKKHAWFKPILYNFSDLLCDDKAVFVVVEFEKFRVVAVRGSYEESDWKANFDVTVATCGFDFTNIHRGFYRRALDIPAELIYHMNDKLIQKRTLFTGHSQGGAAAEIAALSLIVHNLDVAVYTFGAPSIVYDDQNWVKTNIKLLKEKIFRLYFADDLVPISTHVAGFVCFETAVLLKNNSMTITNGIDTVVNDWNFIKQLSFKKVDDKHSILRYCSAVIAETNQSQKRQQNLEIVANYIPAMSIFEKSLKFAHTIDNNNKNILELSGVGLFTAIRRASLHVQDVNGGVSIHGVISCTYEVIEKDQDNPAHTFFSCIFDLSKAMIWRKSTY